MVYEFVIDASRADRDEVCADVKKKFEQARIAAQMRFYMAKNRPDAERHVRMSVFLLPKEEICFVACGDLTGQVAAGLVGAQDNKSMAILDYNITEDLLKSFPDRDFKDFDKMLNGEEFMVDMIKLNDDYSLNVCTAGMSALMAKASREDTAIGLADPKARKKAFLRTLLQSRFNKVTAYADGRRLNGRYLLLVHVSNGQWNGSRFRGAPDAVMDDGLLDVCLAKCVPLMFMGRSIKFYEKGDYSSTRYARNHFVPCRAKHIELDSSHLIYMSYDGEITASTHFDIDVLPKAVKLILPRI